MDTLNPQEETFKPRSLVQMLRENRGSIEPIADPIADPIDDPSLHDPDPIDPNADPDPIADPDPEPAPAVKNWYDGLPEDMRVNPTVQKYKTNEEQVKAHLELAGLLGHEKIALPKDAEDHVAIDHLNKALGVPEDAAGYELAEAKAPDGMEGMEFGDDAFKDIAYKHKLTPAQANGLKADYVEMLTGIREESVKAYTASVEASKASLAKEWGLAYAPKVKIAQDVMNKFAGSKEDFDHINSIIGTDPIALKMLATVGEQFKEGSLGNLGTDTTSFTKTPVEAKAEHDKIMADPNDVYWAGVRNQNPVPESIRKERVAYVESLLMMAQPPSTP